MTKLKFISLSTITKTINTIGMTRTKVVNLNLNELLIRIKRIFDLARATTIEMIQD